MANLSDHDDAGVLIGAALALVLALRTNRSGEPLDIFLEVLGGAIGGKLGSRLPDLIEPATSSWHRSTAHSLAATGVVATLGTTKAESLASQLRAAAEQSRTQAAEQPESALQHQLTRALSRLAVGAAVAVPAGYVSHTVLDSVTPRGIPLITKGF